MKVQIPDMHTDFAYSAAAEEYGLWLSLLLIGLFALLVIRGLYRAMKIADPFELQNLCFMGSNVISGTATGVILHTLTLAPAACTGATVWGAPSMDGATGRIYFGTGNPGTGAGVPTQCAKPVPLSQAVVEVRSSDLGIGGHWQVPVAQAPGDSDFGSTPVIFTRPGPLNRPQTLVGIANKNGVFYALASNKIDAGPVWSFQIAAGGDCAGCGRGSVSPATWDGTNLYVAGGGTTVAGAACTGSVASLDPATGTAHWQDCFTDGVVLGALATAPGIVIVGEGRRLLVLSSATGATLFSYTTSATIWGSPSISHGKIYVGDLSGKLYAFGLPPAA